MRAALVDPTAARLVLTDVADPSPGPGQLLIRVRGAGLNRADLAMIAGKYHGTTAPAPFGAGSELAGEVVEVGAGVDGWQVGDHAMAMGRGYAEMAVVDAALAMPVPASLDLVAAGALPVALATMHDALVTNGRFAAGEHVVVNAASSGVGVVGVQIALHLGAASVIGTSRSAAKRQVLTDLIADDRFVAIAPDQLPAVALDRTGGHGIDVILDNVGASALADNITAAAITGRIAQIGRLGGQTGQLDLDELARKRVALIGVTFRTRTAAERIEVARRAWADVEGGITAGVVRPLVHETYPLEAVPAALEALAQDLHVGKLVITP